MPIQIGQKLESDFSDPLGLLSDCHRRIEHFLVVLTKACNESKGGSLSPERRVALEKSLAYFRDAAPKHTADEEESLFPRLHAKVFDQPDSLLTYLVSLEQEHEIAARDHQLVEQLCVRWLGEGSLAEQESVALTEALARLTELYALHIEMEDRELFPMAARLLRQDELAAVGREMAGRRGIKT